MNIAHEKSEGPVAESKDSAAGFFLPMEIRLKHCNLSTVPKKDAQSQAP